MENKALIGTQITRPATSVCCPLEEYVSFCGHCRACKYLQHPRLTCDDFVSEPLTSMPVILTDTHFSLLSLKAAMNPAFRDPRGKSRHLRSVLFIRKPCGFPNSHVLFFSGLCLHWLLCPVKELYHLFPGNIPLLLLGLVSTSVPEQEPQADLGFLEMSSSIRLHLHLHGLNFVSLMSFLCFFPSLSLLFLGLITLYRTNVLIMSCSSLTWRPRRLRNSPEETLLALLS